MSIYRTKPLTEHGVAESISVPGYVVLSDELLRSKIHIQGQDFPSETPRESVLPSQTKTPADTPSPMTDNAVS